jgi:hypothetical protein
MPCNIRTAGNDGQQESYRNVKGKVRGHVIMRRNCKTKY